MHSGIRRGGPQRLRTPVSRGRRGILPLRFRGALFADASYSASTRWNLDVLIWNAAADEGIRRVFGSRIWESGFRIRRAKKKPGGWPGIKRINNCGHRVVE